MQTPFQIIRRQFIFSFRFVVGFFFVVVVVTNNICTLYFVTSITRDEQLDACVLRHLISCICYDNASISVFLAQNRLNFRLCALRSCNFASFIYSQQSHTTEYTHTHTDCMQSTKKMSKEEKATTKITTIE